MASGSVCVSSDDYRCFSVWRDTMDGRLDLLDNRSRTDVSQHGLFAIYPASEDSPLGSADAEVQRTLESEVEF